MRHAPRVLWEGETDNAQLVRVVTDTARASWPVLVYDGSIPRGRLALACWQYVVDCTTYVPERETQRVRTPWAFVHEGVGDCKSQAVFIASVCKAAGLQTKMCFVSTMDPAYYSHVFAIINGRPVDPLLPFGAACRSLRTLIVDL